MQQTDKIQKRYAVYCRVFTAGLLVTFITFLPYLADYYILQPSDTVLEYFAQNAVNRYLPQILLEYARLPESDMTRILKYQREVFKTNTSRMVTDCYGQQIKSYTMEQIEAIRHFKVVSFDILYGSSPLRNRVWQPYD